MVTIFEHEQPRKQRKQNFERMNLPMSTWGARLSRVDEETRVPIQRYLDRKTRMMTAGMGLKLVGPPGSGKTCLAAGVLKFLNAYGYSAYFTTAFALREGYKAKTQFTQDQSLLSRCLSVDVLAIDNITIDVAKDWMYGGAKVRQLIEMRRDRLQPTLVTTNVDLSAEVSKDLRNLIDIDNAFITIDVVGHYEDTSLEDEVLGEGL